MLIWGFLLALPVGFTMVIIWGICRRLAPRNKILLNGLKGGGIFTYLGAYYFLNVPPTDIIDWLIREEPLTLKALHYLGFRSSSQDPAYLSDMLIALGWLFLLGFVFGAGITLLARRMRFKQYSSS